MAKQQKQNKYVASKPINDDEIAKVIVSKHAKKLLEGLGKEIATDPTAKAGFLGSFSSGAGAGIAVIGAVQKGFELAQNYYDNQSQSAQAISARKDLIRSFSGGLNSSIAREQEQQARDLVLATRGGWQRFKDSLGFTGETEKQITESLQRRLSIIEQGRELVQQFGLDRNTLLSRYAKSKNRTVGELRQEEINQAIDDGLKKILDPRSFSNDPYVKNIVDQQTNFGESVKHQLFTLFGLLGPSLAERYDQVKSAAELERLEKEIKTRQARKHDLHILANQARDNRDSNPATAFKHREDYKTLEATFINFRERHKPTIYD